MKAICPKCLVRACMRPYGFDRMDTIWMASDFNGAFAEYVKVPAAEVFAVNCDRSDKELATIPCAYATAENMLHRTGVQAGDHVLVAGASGGAGSATVQLAKRRGAKVTAIITRSKRQYILDLGADHAVDRGADLVAEPGQNSVDVVADNVAGPAFPQMLKVLRRRGRYISSGAIGGPIVALNIRDMYLKDITLLGCTAWEEPVFPNLISYIERGEFRPLLAKSFPLDQIVAAQKEFMTKSHFGKLVLVPPQGTSEEQFLQRPGQ